MRQKRKSILDRDFYCINCGHKGIPLPREASHLYKSGHRKKLYCPFCRETVNHIECATYEDVIQFKEDFEAGKFKTESAESIAFIKSDSNF